jgi:CheY-like chemotaxis protein
MTSALTVLVVEDDEDDAILMNKVLCRSGITNSIRIVRNGEEAIRYLQGSGEYVNRMIFPLPHIIFTDLKMTGLGGMEVLKWLKSHPSFFVIPVIVLTGSTMDADVQMAYSLGANAYLVKPTHMEDLERIAAEALRYWSSCRTPRPIAV